MVFKGKKKKRRQDQKKKDVKKRCSILLAENTSLYFYYRDDRCNVFEDRETEKKTDRECGLLRLNVAFVVESQVLCKIIVEPNGCASKDD